MGVNPRLLALVVVGGASGTALRAWLQATFPAQPGGWPIATFAINVTGSFVLGLLLQALARGGPDTGGRRALRLGLGTGVLGGYTTYSSFAVDAARLLQSGHLVLALAYALVSVALGLLAAAAGMAVAERWPQRPAGRTDRG